LLSGLSSLIKYLILSIFRVIKGIRHFFFFFSRSFHVESLLASEWGIANDLRTQTLAYVVLAPKKAPGKYAKPANKSV